VLADTEQISNRLQVLQNDYADLRSRAAYYELPELALTWARAT